jgi:exoribonuclease-2
MNSPFLNLKSTLDTDFPAGTVVMFDLEGLPLVGIVTGLKKDRYQILSTSSDTLLELTRNRLHKVPTNLVQDSKEKQLEFLKSVSNNSLDNEQIEQLWKTATTHSTSSSQNVFEKVFHPAELTKLVFKEVTALNYITTRASLILDRIFFRRDEKGFIPRKTNEVAERKEEDKKRQKRFSDYKKLVQFLRAKHKDKSLPIPESLEFYINQLKMCAAVAAYPDESWYQEIEELLHFIEGQNPEFEGRIEQRAFHVLYKAGILKKDSNLSFIRHNPRIDFDAIVLAAADKLTEIESFKDFTDHSIRLDLTHQKCFTIDDASTNDMDDALFLEETDSGYNFYVHISDVSYIILKDSILDIEAKKRATSIYAPDREIPMFPPKVSHQLASLVEGKLRPALTVIFQIDHNFQITSADLEPSVIKVAHRYSYDQIDQKLKLNEEPFSTIASITNLHEQKRRDDGALPVTKRDAQPVLTANGDIAIVEVDEQSPARALIGEAMVLANIVTANFLHANQIPALYRSQERPEIDPGIDLIPDGIARDYAQRGKLKRSVVDLHPMYHATLGTLRYVQSTSPIRRYLDLVLQRQLISFFRSQNPPYSEKDLTLLHQNLDEPLQVAMSVSKESKRFWMLRYLEKYYTDSRSIFGTVVRTDTKFPIVELDELYINVPARISRPALGNRYELKIERVDPRTDFVRLEEVRRR